MEGPEAIPSKQWHRADTVQIGANHWLVGACTEGISPEEGGHHDVSTYSLLMFLTIAGIAKHFEQELLDAAPFFTLKLHRFARAAPPKPCDAATRQATANMQHTAVSVLDEHVRHSPSCLCAAPGCSVCSEPTVHPFTTSVLCRPVPVRRVLFACGGSSSLSAAPSRR